MLGSKRKMKVCVGKGELFQTIKEALRKYYKGSLVIELTSDVMDEEDIHIPKSIKELVIKSSDYTIMRDFKKKDITLYLHNVKTQLINIGVKDGPTANVIVCDYGKVIGKLLIENCCLQSVIGSYECEHIELLNIEIKNSQVMYICGVYELEKKTKIRTMQLNLNHVDGYCVQVFFKKDRVVECEETDIHLKIQYSEFEYVIGFAKKSKKGKCVIELQTGTTLTKGFNIEHYNITPFLRDVN